MLLLLLLIGCVTSQQHASVSQGRICLTSQQHASVSQGRICLTSQQHARVSQGRICLTSQQHARVSQGRICLTSQQHARASQGRICSDNCKRCHTEKEAADQTTSPSHSILTPGRPVPALTLKRQAPGRTVVRRPPRAHSNGIRDRFAPSPDELR